MAARVISETDYGEGRVLAHIRGRYPWRAYLRQTPDGWRVWIHQAGRSALPEEEAVAEALRQVEALEAATLPATPGSV